MSLEDDIFVDLAFLLGNDTIRAEPFPLQARNGALAFVSSN